MAKLFTGDDSSSASSTKAEQPADKNKEQGIFKKITNASWYAMKYFVGATDPDFYDDLGTIKDLPFSSYKDMYSSFTVLDGGKSPGYYVMTFPYTLYYKLQSCVTTNIYEIPAVD